MWREDDLRSALRILERETPAAETVLSRVTERISAGTARHGRLLGRRLVAGSAAAAAVVAIALAAALVTTQPGGPGRVLAQDALRSAPRYYMALVPARPGSPASTAVVGDTVTGKTLAIVRPPKPYTTFIGVTGAADDRTFVLTTVRLDSSGDMTSLARFYYARFNPADNEVTLTPLALPGLAVSNILNVAALSPDGTRLAVASQRGPTSNQNGAQITVYSLPGGAAKTWTTDIPANGPSGQFISDVVDVLSWSRTGILAFGWSGSRTGEFLLDTNGPGGGLLADSRLALCPPSQTIVFSGYLTPDGTKIIMPVTEPVKPGQRPRACLQATPPPRNGRIFPKLEEFSATTGKAIGVIYTSPSPSAFLLLFGFTVDWSNASGSVLVMEGPAGPGPRAPLTYGVLTGGTFTPIPGAPSAVTSLIAF